MRKCAGLLNQRRGTLTRTCADWSHERVAPAVTGRFKTQPPRGASKPAILRSQDSPFTVTVYPAWEHRHGESPQHGYHRLHPYHVSAWLVQTSDRTRTQPRPRDRLTAPPEPADRLKCSQCAHRLRPTGCRFKTSHSAHRVPRWRNEFKTSQSAHRLGTRSRRVGILLVFRRIRAATRGTHCRPLDSRLASLCSVGKLVHCP